MATDKHEHTLINPPLTYPSRLVKPLDVIHHRIKRESVTDGILEGIKLISNPIFRIEGKDQLPNVCLVEYTDVEASWAGAKTNTGLSSNQIELESMATYLLSFPKEHGNYSQPLNQKPWGMVNWVERFKDTIEIGDDGQVDATLEMSCMRPFYTHVRESSFSEISWSILIEVELFPFPLQRGTRRFGWQNAEATKDGLRVPQ